MRLHGIDRNIFNRYSSTDPSWAYDVIAPGFKYNMTDVAASMGLVQLRRAYEMQRRRTEIARRYTEAFAELPVQLPSPARDGDLHSWHLYVLRLEVDAPLSRDQFIARMGEHGITCSVHFIPLHRLSYWRSRYDLRDEDFPVATTAFSKRRACR